MKPASVINRGPEFVTLRTTTDRPAEIRDALAARGIRHVFKGDQNQAWDAVLANHCLRLAVGESAALTFFVQDEKPGTSDVRLARFWRRAGRRYVLTEDYYRGRSGAVWEHQDVSYGLFFTEAVSPEQFERAAVHLHRAAALWERHAAQALQDGEWLAAMAALGVALPGASADAATRLGPAVQAEALAALFREQPAAALYYALTKTDGLYGIVPVEDENVTLSSLPANHPDLRREALWLLVQAAARGAMRMAATPEHRRAIAARARRLADWAGAYLNSHPAASIADFQVALGGWLTSEVFPEDRIDLDRTSRFMRVDRDVLAALREPQDTMHYFLDLALRFPAEFAAAYNEALNRVRLGLQRVKYDPRTGFYTPPFFVETVSDGPGSPVYRFGLQLAGTEETTITLVHRQAGDRVVRAGRPVRSARDLAAALHEHLLSPEGLAIVGKAAVFAAELQRAPRALGLPRQGSKYAPMVDHFVALLRTCGAMDRPPGLLIRIGLNALDRLEGMGDLPLRLPRFLHGALGPSATCREVARRWRGVAAEARELLAILGRCEFGQHVHLVRLMAANAKGNAGLRGDGRAAELAERLRAEPGAERALRALGKDIPLEAAECIERLCRRRETLLAERRELARRARERQPTGRLQPDPERLRAIEQEREQIETQLLLLFAAYVRRLWQRAESLTYVNDRPYTLALYLLFGREIFVRICREVQFDIECVTLCSVEPSACEMTHAGGA